ncbi:MAG TPA: divalent metal cation transporter [bacterium]|nr:divalent metal cation transporter [bacterium]
MAAAESVDSAPAIAGLAPLSGGVDARLHWTASAQYVGRTAAMLAVLGPGLMVMLADTDAGSIVTAAQSGAGWGYQLVLPQILLIPILYVVQEMTVRLGIVTQKGHGELIREHFGAGWAVLSVCTLFLAAVGALVTEFAAIAGVGELLGVPAWLTVTAATLLLVWLGTTGGYRRVERVGIAIGLFELMFLPAAFMAHPDLRALAAQLQQAPLANRTYVLMLAANVGAVIMPWMIFYQQAAVVEKRLRLRHLRHARLDTLIGAIFTQAVMIFVIVAAAATIGRAGSARPLNDIREIAGALQPFIGWTGARVVFGMGMLGAALIAALVVSLAGAWGIGEIIGVPHSLGLPLRDGKCFYAVYTLAHISGAAIVLSGISLVALTINIEVMNALLLPIVLGFLLVLEAKALPAAFRMAGGYRCVAWLLSGLVIVFGLFMMVHILV